MGYGGRDIEVVETGANVLLVIACDSCGSVGSKELDSIPATPEIVGRLTARTVLMELVSVGALPVALTVAICAEPQPTGDAILCGVREELRISGLSTVKLAVSTEKNFPTRQTGLGIGATGTCSTDGLKVSQSQPTDKVFCLGLPMVGAEVIESGCMDNIHSGTLLQLRNHPLIHDILPVGSRGILAEAELLAKQSSTTFTALNGCTLDLEKSAGPSTCVLFTSQENIEDLKELEPYFGKTVLDTREAGKYDKNNPLESTPGHISRLDSSLPGLEISQVGQLNLKQD